MTKAQIIYAIIFFVLVYSFNYIVLFIAKLFGIYPILP